MTTDHPPADDADPSGANAAAGDLPRRTPGALAPGTPVQRPAIPDDEEMRTQPVPPESSDAMGTYQQFAEARSNGAPPYVWDVWSWWLRSEIDPEYGPVPGDRITLGRFAGPPYGDENVFTLLTSSRDGGVPVADLFGYTGGMGDPVTVSRDELVQFARWVIVQFDDEFGGTFGGRFGNS